MEPIHNRMPVILTEHGEKLWMDADAPTEEALSVLAPYPADLMETYTVSTAVNAPKRDAPDRVEPRSPMRPWLGAIASSARQQLHPHEV
jgi:putative SOS response-associated peptidase YedK